MTFKVKNVLSCPLCIPGRFLQPTVLTPFPCIKFREARDQNDWQNKKPNQVLLLKLHKNHCVQFALQVNFSIVWKMLSRSFIAEVRDGTIYAFNFHSGKKKKKKILLYTIHCGTQLMFRIKMRHPKIWLQKT